MAERKPCAREGCERTLAASDAHRLCTMCRRGSQATAERPTKCIVCDEPLEIIRRGSVKLYCSSRCAQRARYKHAAPRFTECQQCGGALPEPRDVRTKYCSDPCSQKSSRIRNAEKIAEGKKRYYRENPEKHKVWEERRKPKKNEYMRAYYWANREARLEYQRSAETRARERERERRRYAENPAPKKAAVNKWIKGNREAASEIRRRRRARVLGAPTIKFTPDQLHARLAFWGHRCWLCLGEANQIDHMKPISKGGWHALCNLRPICISCNASKGNRWPFTVRPGAFADEASMPHMRQAG